MRKTHRGDREHDLTEGDEERERDEDREMERKTESDREKGRAKQRGKREYRKDGDHQSFEIAHSSPGKFFSLLSEMIDPIEFASYILVVSVYIFVYSVFKVHYQTIKEIHAIIIDFFNGMRLIKF